MGMKRKGFCPLKAEVVIYIYKKVNMKEVPRDPYYQTHKCTPNSISALTSEIITTVDVALTLNGVQLGAAKTSTNHIFSWSNVTLAHGANTVVATGVLGGVTYTMLSPIAGLRLSSTTTVTGAVTLKALQSITA